MSKAIQRRASETIEVTFDPNLCSHSAECLRRLPDVFNLGARPWIQPEFSDADSLAETIRHCPSGALQYHRLDGGPEEAPDAAYSVRPQRNGPIHVRGDVDLVDGAGDSYRAGPRVALCRCGVSANKPFCDGSHREARFRAP